MHIYVYVCIYVYVYMCVHIYTYIYMYTYMYMYIHMHIHTYIHIRVYIYIYIYIYMHICSTDEVPVCLPRCRCADLHQLMSCLRIRYTYIHVYVYMRYTYIHVYVYIRYTYIHVYVYIRYIHVYTYTTYVCADVLGTLQVRRSTSSAKTSTTLGLIHPMSHHHTYYVTSSYILCHIIIHTMSHQARRPQPHWVSYIYTLYVYIRISTLHYTCIYVYLHTGSHTST